MNAVESTAPASSESEEANTSHPPGNAVAERMARARMFIEVVRRLANGPRAVLRRAAGSPLSQARNCSWFYGLIRPGYQFYDAESLFLIATLMTDNRAAQMPEFRGDFGKSLRQLANHGGEGGVERRLRTLLDADFDAVSGDGSLAHHLRQLSMRMLAGRIPIDWAQLLVDVLAWNHPNRYVQRNWAISFYGAGDEERPIAAGADSASSTITTNEPK